MKPLRVLIIDDEALDRELLRNLVHQYCSSIRIVGEASNAEAGAALISAHSPDLLFLDINMPNKNGFGLLEELKERTFLTVFTTGYNAYGIQAVKAGAFDYLLKPIDVDELLTLEKKATEYVRKQTPVDTFRIYAAGEHLLLRIEDVLLIEAHGSYSKLILADGREHVLSKNMKQLLSEITDKRLQRVHRSSIINTAHIKSVQFSGNEGIVTLRNNLQVSISRSYKNALKKWLA